MTNILILCSLLLQTVTILAVFGIKKEVEKIMPTIDERFTQLTADLDEASSEILAELEKLRAGGLTPEQEALLQGIEGKVGALKDISPPIPPP